MKLALLETPKTNFLATRPISHGSIIYSSVSNLAVSDVTFSSITTDSFTVSWTIPSNYLDHVNSYDVTWTPSTGQPIVVEKDKSSAVITGLSPGEIYSVTVTSVNARTQWDTSRNFAISKQQVSSK